MADDEEIERVRKKRFLLQYDPRNGEYRGPDPPRKDDVLQLDPEDGPWEDEWLDWTGKFKLVDGDLRKQTQCKCGNYTWGGPRARFVRCSVCHRVMVDLEWEDDRYKNPRNKEEPGLERFMQ